MAKGRKIIALTTDPYDNIYGYTLVFIKLFDFMQKDNQDLKVILMSNDGVCSKIVKNKKFIKIKLNPKSRLLSITFSLVYSFIKKVWSGDKNTILVANNEIPELLSALILKIKFKKVYCVIQDLRLRDESSKTKLIHKLRLFLIYRIKNVIFTNKYTMGKLNNSINKFYIGNPIF